MWDFITVGNALLLLCSSMLLCLTILYLKRKWPDIDAIDVYIIFIALHFGVYPFIRGLYVEEGFIFNSFNNNLLIIGIIYLQILLIIIIMRAISEYLPAEIKKYLKIKTMIELWSRVNEFVLLSLYSLLILFVVISYLKYGVKAHISHDEYLEIGKDLPYWLTSVRTIFNYLVFCVFIVLVSKASMSESLSRYFWIVLIIFFLPFVAYFSRKTFANAVVVAALIWLVRNEENTFQFKYLKIAALMMFSFIVMSNIYQTYRPVLQSVSVSLRQLENPITAALNFKATLQNLKIRPGTWEFNYLVLDKQMRGPEKVTTNGKITWEGFKSTIPRILWPGKKFQMTSEVMADKYKAKLEDVSLGSNIFGVAQSEIGYYSIIIVPLTIILIIVIMAGLMKLTSNYPVFYWFLSINLLNLFMYVEENQPENNVYVKKYPGNNGNILVIRFN